MHPLGILCGLPLFFSWTNNSAHKWNVQQTKNTIVGPILDCLDLSVAIHIKWHNVVLEEKFKLRIFILFP